MNRPARILCGAVAMVLSMSACGGSTDETPPAGQSPTIVVTTPPPSGATSPSGATAAVDFCTLVTADEAASAADSVLGPGKSQGETQAMGLVGSCQYFGTDNPVGLAATVVQVIVLGTKVPRAVFDQEILGDAADGTPIPGLGETAFALPGIQTVFDQGVVLTLQVMNHSVPADQATITTLLRTALGRVGGLS